MQNIYKIVDTIRMHIQTHPIVALPFNIEGNTPTPKSVLLTMYAIVGPQQVEL